MPYVEPVLRIALKNIEEVRPRTKAELNFLICKLALQFLAGQQKVGYQELSDAKAAMLDAADEFTRRIIWPYEDKARLANGDFFPTC